MKKIFAVLSCLILILGCVSVMAESAEKEDYTVVSVNGAFNIRGVTPEGYHLADLVNDNAIMQARFVPDNPEKPSFDLVISFLEEYAGVERLNDLNEDERKGLVGDDPTLSEEISVMETEFGTQVMILRSNNPKDDFVCFVTVYKGYEVGLNLYYESGETLADEQIQQAMKFLSDLDFVPIES